LKPWLVERFCIPPSHNAPFVHAMEDVLDVYQRPYDPLRPQVCVDETSKQSSESGVANSVGVHLLGVVDLDVDVYLDGDDDVNLDGLP